MIETPYQGSLNQKTSFMNELMNPTKAVIILAAIIAGCVLLFLLFRFFVLWYYKIDTRVENQKKIIHLLTELVKATREVNKLS